MIAPRGPVATQTATNPRGRRRKPCEARRPCPRRASSRQGRRQSRCSAGRGENNARLAALEVVARRGAGITCKLGHHLARERVGGTLARGVRKVARAVDKTRQHAGARKCPAGALHAAHAKAQTFTRLEKRYLVNAHEVRVRASNCLGAVVAPYVAHGGRSAS